MSAVMPAKLPVTKLPVTLPPGTVLPALRRGLLALAAHLLLALPACAAGAAGTAGGSEPNVLVMGEDADDDSLPRGSSAFMRVRDAMATALHEAGFDVYDETAVTFPTVVPGRVRRDDAELIEIARDTRRPPIDVLAIFTLYAAVTETDYTARLQARVAGRLMNVQTGQSLGAFEVATLPGWRVAPSCGRSRHCLTEAIGERAAVLGRDVAAVLAEKLAHLTDGTDPAPAPAATAAGTDRPACLPNAFTLVFDGFSSAEMLEIEEYLVVFSGYRGHRPSETAGSRHEIWYRTCSAPARLQRNLTRMLDHMDLRARLALSGNLVELKRLTLRQQR